MPNAKVKTKNIFNARAQIKQLPELKIFFNEKLEISIDPEITNNILPYAEYKIYQRGLMGEYGQLRANNSKQGKKC